jgi:hypothetical protein
MNLSDPIFIFPFNKALKKDQEDQLIESMKGFLCEWQAHGKPLKSTVWIEESYFLCISVDESQAHASGCSKDKLYQFVQKEIESKKLEAAALNKFFLHNQGEVHSYTRKEIQEGFEKKSISADTTLFPTWVGTMEEYHQLWKKPLSSFSKILRLPEKESNFTT